MGYRLKPALHRRGRRCYAEARTLQEKVSCNTKPRLRRSRTPTMPLSYREFDGTDADYQLLAEIDSSVGDVPRTAEDVRQEEKWWESDQFHRREFILAGGKCIGADLEYHQGEGAGATHSLFFTLLPAYCGQGLDEEILEHLIDQAKNRGAASVRTNSRDVDSGRIQAIERLGFQFSTSYVDSRLDLDRFDPGITGGVYRWIDG